MGTMFWSEKCSHICYGLSSRSIIGYGYKMIDASFIQQMSVLKSLRNLSTFLESSQQSHDSYRELGELMIISLCDISPFGNDLWLKALRAMHQDSKLFIHSFILNIYIAPLQENYSEALPTPARLKRAVLS